MEGQFTDPGATTVGSARARRVAFAALLVMALIAAACGSSEAGAPRPSRPEPTTVPSTSDPAGSTTTVEDSATTTTELTAPAPGDCIGTEQLDRSWLTWAKIGHLWALDESGRAVCVLRLGNDAVTTMSWSPDGDSVQFNGRTAISVESVGALDVDVLGWSAPTGRRLLGIDNVGRVVKQAPGQPQSQLIFDPGLVTDAAYHPEGRHVFVAGSQTEVEVDGDPLTYGIWLVANNNSGDVQIVFVPEEVRIDELVPTEAGDALMFVAEHEEVFHLHRYDLLAFGLVEEVAVNDEGALAQLVEQEDPIDSVTIDRSGQRIAFRSGRCGMTARIDVDDEGVADEPRLLLEQPSEPLGFGPDGELAVLSHSTGCGGVADVYVIDDGGEPVLVASDVDAAAIRRPQRPATTEVPSFVGGQPE